MNGAEALVQALGDSGVEVCFANPGTSEMQLVAAIDKQPNMRAILCLFEGVATGAADGYGRIADRPSTTLLHLGPGLANGCANLHNARRARTPVINLVGDHADSHLQYDAPLTSDVLGVARPMSDWVGVSRSSSDLAELGVTAVEAALTYPGQVATLVVPANHAWEAAGASAQPSCAPAVPHASDAAVAAAAEALTSEGNLALFLGGRALREEALLQAARVAEATGARLICETFPARLQRGVGRAVVERLPYFGEVARDFLSGFAQIVFVGSPPPVAFFAYPGKPSWLCPPTAGLSVLATPREDPLGALARLADALNAPTNKPSVQEPDTPGADLGRLSPKTIGAVLASLVPPDTIISDEATTASVPIYNMLAGAAPHDWLTLTGGSIGQGLPVAVGASVACPDRKVIALQADGSAMYTLQALWTMAREGLNITVVILNNGSYSILKHELQRVGAGVPGPKALSLLDLTRPALDWVALSSGMGVPAVRANTVEESREAMAHALPVRGPRLVEAWMIRA